MTMKRIEVPWTPACEREETALPRTGPAKTKFKGSTRETRKHPETKLKGSPHGGTQYTQTKFKGSSRETRKHTHKQSSTEAQENPTWRNTHTHKQRSREAQGKPAWRHKTHKQKKFKDHHSTKPTYDHMTSQEDDEPVKN